MENNDRVPGEKINKSQRTDKPYCDWENLPDDPLIEIAQLLPSFEDFIALHLICTTWTSALRLSNCKFLHGRGAASRGTPQIPWIMLSEHEDVELSTPVLKSCSSKLDKEAGERRGKGIRLFFYSLLSKRICNLVIRLPLEFGDDYDFKDCCCLSSNGWFLMVRMESALSLYSPFCSTPHNYIPLPGPESLYHHLQGSKHIHVEKFVVSTTPSTNRSLTVMITYFGGMAMWKSGDKCWTSLVKCHRGLVMSQEDRVRCDGILDATFCGGQFYVLTDYGEIMRFGLRVLTDDQYIEWGLVAKMLPPKKLLWSGHLVVLPNNESKMLAVLREPRLSGLAHYGDHHNLTAGFKVMLFNIDAYPSVQYMKVVRSLGNRSLFVGDSQSLCFKMGSPKNSCHGLKPDCIYFTWCNKSGRRSIADSLGKGMDVGVYNMDDSTFDRHFQGLSLDHFSPLMWVQPRS